MCLDIAFYSALELIDDYFPALVHDTEINFDMDMSVHVMALGYKKYPVVTIENENFHRKYFEWGVIAEYMDTSEKVKAMRNKMVNARSEKILGDKKSFWHRIRHKRCLIPVTGIYEHREILGWKNKVPYHVSLKDRKMFCIPGLYHHNFKIPSDQETGEVRGMFAMLTTEGNTVMRQIHNSGDNKFRMPVFLPKEMEMRWLDPKLTEQEMQEILSFRMPSEALEYRTVFSIRGRAERPDHKPKNELYLFDNCPPLGNDDGGSKTQMELF
jgi:putative SOS response-associated peptidase YedK